MDPFEYLHDPRSTRLPALPNAVEPGRRLLLRYAAVGAMLMIPPYVLLFVMGRHPDPGRSDPWGWRAGAVVSGVVAGVVVGGVLGLGGGLLRLMIRNMFDGD